MPFPPSPMSLPQQPHGGGGAPPDLSSVVDKFMKKNPDAVKQPANPFDLEDIIRQAGKPKLPKMPLPPPGIVADEEGRKFPEFNFPSQDELNWNLAQNRGENPFDFNPGHGNFREGFPDWPPGGELQAPTPPSVDRPWQMGWGSPPNPPTRERLPQMPLPPPGPSMDHLYRGLMPPEERIWHDKPWT